MTTDERIDRLVGRHEALTMNLELLTRDVQDLTRDVQDLKTIAQQDGEHIRGLVRVAEIHHERLSHL
jgi:prefoldin subunit 5